VREEKLLIKNILVIGIIILFLGTCITPSVAMDNVKKSSIPISNGYIQNLIDNASAGDSIYIPNGTYYENIVIDKSISLLGEHKNTTIIDGNFNVNVVTITADWVNISGFTIQNSGNEFNNAGIFIVSNNNNINNNILSNNEYGIYISGCINCTISNNTVFFNKKTGIKILLCKNIIILGNIISNNECGIYLEGWSNHNINSNFISSNKKNGINLYCIGYSTIKDNIISNNRNGICSYNSGKNTFINNTINSNDINGLELSLTDSDTVCGNSILNNRVGIVLKSGFFIIINRNNILNNSEGICLSFICFWNTIKENNFINNKRDAFINNSFRNRWNGNYWNKPRILPKLIFGIICWYTPYPELREIVIPWIPQIDWHPAKEPYDIEV